MIVLQSLNQLKDSRNKSCSYAVGCRRYRSTSRR